LETVGRYKSILTEYIGLRIYYVRVHVQLFTCFSKLLVSQECYYVHECLVFWSGFDNLSRGLLDI